MLTIRLQRTGRSGHASFRVVVQDSHWAPSSGKVVAQLGHYDPHTKAIRIDKEKAELYLQNGAQPSERVALLLKKEGVKLPKWVQLPTNKKKRETRNADKLRKNRPAEAAPAQEANSEPKAEDTVEPAADEPAEVAEKDTEAETIPAEEPIEAAAEEKPEEAKPKEPAEISEKPADAAPTAA